MYVPTLIFGVTINIGMVAIVVWILSLMCSGYHLLISSYLCLSTSSIPSLEASWWYLCLELLGCRFLSPMFSKYCACTHASSIVLGLKNIT
jgi:hypothetical protein